MTDPRAGWGIVDPGRLSPVAASDWIPITLVGRVEQPTDAFLPQRRSLASVREAADLATVAQFPAHGRG
ncbi:MAG TPA: hypothetical protein VGV40_06960 [Solirubrobacteraceae bacterium]|nr:hypothetical protein [Solirubrobacteraceae bacterium]